MTPMGPVSSFPDLPEISDFEDSVSEDQEYFTSSISSLIAELEKEPGCCTSFRQRFFPSLGEKFFKIMQKEDFLPGLKKLRKSIKDNAKLEQFYTLLLPLIINNPQIFYDVGMEKDVEELSPLLIEKIGGLVDLHEKVEFFLQLYNLEKHYNKPNLLGPLLTKYIQEYVSFELFEDTRFLCLFHNKSCQLNKDLLLKLIDYLEEKGKLPECIGILTLAEVKNSDVTLFRSTNLLSQITAGYGARVFSSILKGLEKKLNKFLKDINVFEYQHENSEVSSLAKEKRRKSMKIRRNKLEKKDFDANFKKLKRKGFPKIEEKNKRFLVLVDMFLLELFSCPFPKEGTLLLLQRKEILEKKGFDAKTVSVYLGEFLFLRIINPYLTNMKICEQRVVILQLAKILQRFANHTTYDDFNFLSWINPYLERFSDQFDQFITNLDNPKGEVL